MAKYTVEVPQVWVQTYYEVEADSEEEAKDKVKAGGVPYHLNACEYSRDMGTDLWNVEEVEDS